MILNRVIFPCVLLGLIGVTTVTLFRFYYYTEKPFYLRLKNRKKRPIYQLSNIRINGPSLFADIKQKDHNFTFKLDFLEDEIVRFQITDPHLERYLVQDVILEPKILKKDNIFIRNLDSLVQVHYKNLKLHFNCHNFEINFYKNNNLLFSLNTHNRLIIEAKEPTVAIAGDFYFNETKRIYGFPQRAEHLSLQSTNEKLYRLYNVDRFAYSSKDPHQSLYGAVPLIYAFSPNQTTGLFWLNSSETYLDLEYGENGALTTFFSESGAMEFYVLTGPTLPDCVKQYSKLTGVTPLPPLFALGYHQSRFSYMTQEEVVEVSNNFDEHNFPLDSLWLDIDYTDGKKYFTWNPETYPDPAKLLDYLHSKKRKMVTIIDPHIKTDDDYFVYAHCKKESFLVKNQNDSVFMAKCWPGTSSWIDFFNPNARTFYADLHKDFANARNLHIWNDMNEPALFETPENSMDKNAVHYGNWKHRDVHNLYGFYQTMATYEGLLKRDNLRPFILTRSHFAGSQRYAAIWTGDNTADWSHLKVSIPMCLTASLAGFSLCGGDIGGFVKHPDDELLQRWYQLGAWLPFFRGHSNRNVPRREPYLYNAEIQQRIRNAIQQRYRHLFYWYTLFWQHCTKSEPVIRPLIYQYPNNDKLLDVDHGFFVGENILVYPVVSPDVNEMEILLPGENNEIWYYTEIGKYNGSDSIILTVDLDTVPIFYRGGSIIPMIEHPQMTSSVSIYEHPITLCIFCDTQGNANGCLYSDDTESFDYLKTDYSYISFNLSKDVISNNLIRDNFHQPIILGSIHLYGYIHKVQNVNLTINNDIIIHSIDILNSSVIKLSNINVDIKKKFRILLV